MDYFLKNAVGEIPVWQRREVERKLVERLDALAKGHLDKTRRVADAEGAQAITDDGVSTHWVPFVIR